MCAIETATVVPQLCHITHFPEMLTAVVGNIRPHVELAVLKHAMPDADQFSCEIRHTGLNSFWPLTERQPIWYTLLTTSTPPAPSGVTPRRQSIMYFESAGVNRGGQPRFAVQCSVTLSCQTTLGTSADAKTVREPHLVRRPTTSVRSEPNRGQFTL